jgi:hypothetical protein
VRKFGNDSHPQCGENPKPFTKRTHRRRSRSPSMFKSLIEGSRGRCRLVRPAHIQAEESALMALVRIDSLVATVANARHGIATTVDLPRGISNDPCCPSDLCERNCDYGFLHSAKVRNQSKPGTAPLWVPPSQGGLMRPCAPAVVYGIGAYQISPRSTIHGNTDGL